MEQFETRVLIIGAGLFGSMVAKHLRSKGIDSLIVDRRDPLSASKCSSGIWRPGWAGKIAHQVEQSLPIISLYTAVDTLNIYDADKEVETSIDFIDCNNILDEEFIEGEVVGCSKETSGKVHSVYVEVDGTKIEIDCEYLLICAGAWTNAVLEKLKLPVLFGLDAHWGAVLHCQDKLQRNFIQNWAPYKQLYGLNLVRNGQEVSYFTMGMSAKNPPRGGDNRTLAIGEKMEAAARGFKMKQIIEIPEGNRPFFSEKDTDFVNRHGANVWSATGGAKNSTLLCGYVAQRIFQEITGKNN